MTLETRILLSLPTDMCLWLAVNFCIMTGKVLQWWHTKNNWASPYKTRWGNIFVVLRYYSVLKSSDSVPLHRALLDFCILSIVQYSEQNVFQKIDLFPPCGIKMIRHFSALMKRSSFQNTMFCLKYQTMHAHKAHNAWDIMLKY
jgi:hypothetical protein